MPHEYQVGVKGIIVRDGAALLVSGQLTTTGEYWWDLPGGRMEKGESIPQALERELREELPSLETFEVEGLVHAYASRHMEAGKDLITLCFAVTADLPEVKLSDEHDEYRWVDLAELETLEEITKTPAFSGHLDAVRKVLTAT